MMRTICNKRGMALITVYMIIMALLVLLGAYYWRSFNESRFAQRERDETKAYYIAEAGLAQVAMDIYHNFNAVFLSNRPNDPWMADTYEQDFRTVVNNYDFPVTINTPEGLTCTVMLPANSDPVVVTSDGVLLKLIAIGTAPHLEGIVRKKIASTISYEMKQSPIFNNAYFINKSGRFFTFNTTVNGDVRSNANFSFFFRPLINGDIYAAENPDLETVGRISGRTQNWSISDYQSNYPTGRTRPTNPTGPPNPGGEVYDAGYDGESERFEHQNVLDMPYLGDLGDYLGLDNAYRRLASDENGQITQGGKVLVNNVYEGKGPDKKKNTPDDGCIVLIGTEKKPIEIWGYDEEGNKIPGVVVIDKDVIIKGVISGQGIIYAGRNIHIVGDVTYKNSPSWPKPDLTPRATAETNKTKDFVGFAAKGNMIIGDYTTDDWKKSCEGYLRPPFVQGYEVDSTDAPLGYDSDGDPTNGYWFNGNYTAYDGGYKDDGADGSTERKFYESSLSDDYINSIATPLGRQRGRRRWLPVWSGGVQNIDGVVYNNHALAGQVCRLTINGSIATRNEAITEKIIWIFRRGFTINYDVRAHSRSIDSVDINLPRSLNLPEVRARQGG